MDKFLSRSIAVAILFVGIGVFYYYVVHLPAEDRRERAANAQASETQAQQQKQRAARYKVCMSTVHQGYARGWAEACKSVAEKKARELKNCLSNPAITNNRYMGRSWCEKNYGDIDPSPKCSLPRDQADLENKYAAEGEKQCAYAAQMGLQ